MDRQTAVAQLCIVDGTWQENPDSLAIVQDLGRGMLYLLTEVQGEAEGRDELARELIETARRVFTANRGSVAHALTLAVRAANECFYNHNAGTVPEARRIAGLTAVVWREDELFINQAGPGLTCVVRGNQLLRFPEESPWYDPGANADFKTPGTFPLGMRKEYHPDFFHVTLAPGDIILIATQALVHLLTREELIDTLKSRHPDTIVDNLEDVAGTTTLSAIAIRLAGADEEAAPDVDSEPESLGAGTFLARGAAEQPTTAEVRPIVPSEESVEQDWQGIAETGMELEHQFHRELDSERDERLVAEGEEEARSVAVAQTLSRRAAGAFTSIDWAQIGTGTRSFFSLLLRALVPFIRFSARAFLPGDPGTVGEPAQAHPKLSAAKAWRIAALVFPVVLLLAGGVAWVSMRAELQQRQAAQVADLLDQAGQSVEQAKKLARTDKAGATAAFQRAISLSQQALKTNPNSANARSALYQAEDLLDDLNGISVVSPLTGFASFTDPASKLGRVVAHIPYVFVFDRGAQRIYRYAVNDAASTIAPFDKGEGIILKKEDKIAERAVGEIIDIVWTDSGRLVALDRGGQFLIYDPLKASWSARPATDGAQWAKVTIASSYVGNLYLLDPSKNQIWKYVPNAEGIWSTGASYFASGVNVDLASAIDIAIDGDLWVLRGDGSVWRFVSGRLADFTLDTAISKPVALTTTQTMVGLYVADAGTQRIVQFDKVTGKYMRQFKPRVEVRDWFDALQAMTADEISKKFFIVNGTQAYVGNIPQ